MPIAILVHGGAGARLPDDRPDEATAACLEAARRGHDCLRRGGSALDAVVAATSYLEDHPAFNAGFGAALTSEGNVELDASVMEGQHLGAGAVAALKGFANPVHVARRVMERTPHVLLAGEGAERFAREQGFVGCDPSALITPRARRRWEDWKRANHALSEDGGTHASGDNRGNHGTVGAVAVDVSGHVAAATSTGGLVGKLPGRVGDTPLIGSGTYADDALGAVSATGHGESIIKVCLARHACDLMQVHSPDEAMRRALQSLARVQGHAGLISVDAAGRLGFAYNTERMARAGIDAAGNEMAAY